jgi:hypothetical protein
MWDMARGGVTTRLEKANMAAMFSLLTWDTSMWDMARGGGTARLDKANMAAGFFLLTWDTSMWDMARGGGTARLEKPNMAAMFSLSLPGIHPCGTWHVGAEPPGWRRQTWRPCSLSPYLGYIHVGHGTWGRNRQVGEAKHGGHVLSLLTWDTSMWDMARGGRNRQVGEGKHGGHVLSNYQGYIHVGHGTWGRNRHVGEGKHGGHVLSPYLGYIHVGHGTWGEEPPGRRRQTWRPCSISLPGIHPCVTWHVEAEPPGWRRQTWRPYSAGSRTIWHCRHRNQVF